MIKSISTAAKKDELAELFDKFNSVPYDDCVNRKATIKDVRRGFVEDFLNDSNSTLAKDINKNTLEELLISLEAADETDTKLDIRNIGVLMFSERIERIMIINYPGLAKWIDLGKFAEGKAKARKYRNRRIGELFKEIDLSEKQGTGITKILRELKKNGSPLPTFEMDEDRTYLETIIYIKEGFNCKKMSESMSELEQIRMNSIIDYLKAHSNINSSIAAELMEVQPKTMARLLAKAEKIGLLLSTGKTKSKVYMLK